MVLAIFLSAFLSVCVYMTFCEICQNGLKLGSPKLVHLMTFRSGVDFGSKGQMSKVVRLESGWATKAEKSRERFKLHRLDGDTVRCYLNSTVMVGVGWRSVEYNASLTKWQGRTQGGQGSCPLNGYMIVHN